MCFYKKKHDYNIVLNSNVFLTFRNY
ncbi:hypothetical protein B566_EDAN014177 [Ephemera danica]|nr:hypothetical protein B566_EDAN014177 [Ephemera danica]